MHEEKGANHIMSEPKMKQCVVNVVKTLVLEKDHHFWGGGHVFSLYWSFEKEEGKLSCPLSSLHCLDASNGWWPRRTFQYLLSGTRFIFPPLVYSVFTFLPSLPPELCCVFAFCLCLEKRKQRGVIKRKIILPSIYSESWRRSLSLQLLADTLMSEHSLAWWSGLALCTLFSPHLIVRWSSKNEGMKGEGS